MDEKGNLNQITSLERREAINRLGKLVLGVSIVTAAIVVPIVLAGPAVAACCDKKCKGPSCSIQ